MDILYKSRDVIVINKPAGIPTQSDKSGDLDALTVTSEMLSQSGEKSELWLVHRLDRVVGGVLLFARTKAACAYISELIQKGKLEKRYFAIAEGTPKEGEYTDFLYKDSAKGKAFAVERERRGVKEARLICNPIKSVTTERGVYTLVEILLITGRFHQIRVQLASRGTPIVGDGKYGSHDNKAPMPALMSHRVTLKLKSENIDVRALPDRNVYPWSLFDAEDFDI